jgi:hypothetical protein
VVPGLIFGLTDPSVGHIVAMVAERF